MQSELSQQDRDTLNAAMGILQRSTAYKSSWQIGVNHYCNCDPSFDATYFDSCGGQHSWVQGETFADKVQSVLGIEGNAAANTEKYRKERIERLRKQLSELTGEPA